MTAAQNPILGRGPGSDSVYARHGMNRLVANVRRQMGIPATVAKAFSGTPAQAELDWLARTFSVLALRTLAARNLNTNDLALLHRLTQQNLATVRGYVSHTRLRVTEIEWLMAHGVSCQSTLRWTRRLPVAHEDANLVTVLTAATIVHGVPREHVAGWVKYANRFEVDFSGSQWPWSFLGGDTALMAAAGLSPVEARRMTRTNTVDRAALVMLAGLRAGSTGVR